MAFVFLLQGCKMVFFFVSLQVANTEAVWRISAAVEPLVEFFLIPQKK